jgi:hypothetical protein
MSGEFSSDEIGEIVTMILGTVHPVFVGNFNPVLTECHGFQVAHTTLVYRRLKVKSNSSSVFWNVKLANLVMVSIMRSYFVRSSS